MKGKVIALLVAALILAASISAFAATTIDVTVNDNTHADFYAIQIFTGTQLTDEDDQPLGDIVWGSDVSGKENDVIAAVNSALGLNIAEGTSALNVAKAISDAEPDTAAAEKLAKALNDKIGSVTGTKLTPGTTTGVDAGWYLVVDRSTLGDNDAKNASVLQFTRDITISKKTDAPTQEKKVKEDTTYTDEDGYNDVADYDIGEEVPFQITSKIPDISKYAKYEMTFTDTMSDGLDFTASSIKVTIGETEYDADAIGGNAKIVLTPSTHGFTLKLVIKEAAADGLSGTTTDIYEEDADITIDFTGKLNTNAVIGLPGNTNTSKLTYTNSPDADDTNDSTKDTPEDKVVVLTYELDTTKVDGAASGKTLEGAKFVLKNSDKSKYAQMEADGKTFKAWVAQADATEFETPANGKFAIIGLDEGTYYLEETKAPTGYNILTEDIEIVISATYLADRQSWDGEEDSITALKITVDGTEKAGDKNSGIVALDVANNSGVTLPSTGGIGTRIFYIGGSILVLAAVVLLITKRRMSAND